MFRFAATPIHPEIPPPRQAPEPAPIRSAKVLSLLLILEALRQTPVSLTAQKV